MDWAYEMIFAAAIGGLVGSRLDYLIQNWDDVSRRPARQPVLGLAAWCGSAGWSAARSA